MYYRPAEWRKNKILWLAWPYDEGLWGEDLRAAQREFVALVQALSREELVILVPSLRELDRVSREIEARPNLTFKVIPYGDIWLRDTLPLFVKNEQEQTVAMLPQFNGWGGKYLFEDDKVLSTRVADALAVPKVSVPLVFEGGAVECDGEGTLLTTEQCLLNQNRNPNISRAQIEEIFAEHLGIKKVVWIKDGLKNDHTDGHIDTIARFVAPAQVAIMVPENKSDPNYDVLNAIKRTLEQASDANGNPFQVMEIPSPGAVVDGKGKIMPASYLNFIMGDQTLVVPTYGSPNDDKAVEIFAKHSNLNVVGLSAKSILSGGGAFHCISQEFYR